MSKTLTYTQSVVQSLLPADGWHAVYCYDGVHDATPIHCLAYVHQRTYNAQTGVPLPSRIPADECWDISGAVYLNPIDGWTLCIEDGNYCGLLPPGETVAAFFDDYPCASCPRPQRVVSEEVA
jgi:hypothetical protein